jgi:hypothetical protein
LVARDGSQPARAILFYGAVIPAEEAILQGTGLQIGIVYEMANIISAAFYAA